MVTQVDIFAHIMEPHNIQLIQITVSYECRNMIYQQELVEKQVKYLMVKLSEKQRFVAFVDLSRIGFETRMIKALVKCSWKFVVAMDLSKSRLSSRGLARIFRNNYKYLKDLTVF